MKFPKPNRFKRIMFLTLCFTGMSLVMTACDSKPKQEANVRDTEPTSTSRHSALKNADEQAFTELSVAIGKQAPEIRLEAVFGGPETSEVTLAKLRGNVVVLEYWATW